MKQDSYTSPAPIVKLSDKALKIVVIGVVDSQLKWAYSVAEKLTSAKSIKVFIPNDDPKFDLDEDEIRDMGLSFKPKRGKLSALESMMDMDAVIGILPPDLHRRLTNYLEQWRKEYKVSGPCFVTGNPGLIINIGHYLENRSGADVICLNSQAELSEAKMICTDFGYDGSRLVNVEFPYALAGKSPRKFKQAGEGRTVVFTTQPHWPKSKGERLYILERFLRAAQKFPQDRFLIKLRMREGRRSFHEEKFHYEQIYSEDFGTPPPNLLFSYGPVAESFSKSDLHVTVASTALFESLAMGIPSALISDFGSRVDYAAHYFKGSGLFLPLDTALEGASPIPDPEWLAMNGLSGTSGIAAVRELIIDHPRAKPSSILDFKPVYIRRKPTPLAKVADKLKRKFVSRILRMVPKV